MPFCRVTQLGLTGSAYLTNTHSVAYVVRVLRIMPSSLDLLSLTVTAADKILHALNETHIAAKYGGPMGPLKN